MAQEVGGGAATLRRMPAPARRQQLLDTAGALLLDQGFEALTMESIALAAGASKTLGYAYFPNVAELIWELYQRELSALYARIENAADRESSFEGRVRAAIHAYLDAVEDKGDLLFRLQSGVQASGLSRRRSDTVEDYVAYLGEMIRAEYPMRKRRAIAHATAISSAADTYARMWRFGAFTRPEIERASVEFVLAGIRAAVVA